MTSDDMVMEDITFASPADRPIVTLPPATRVGVRRLDPTVTGRNAGGCFVGSDAVKPLAPVRRCTLATLPLAPLLRDGRTDGAEAIDEPL